MSSSSMDMLYELLEEMGDILPAIIGTLVLVGLFCMVLGIILYVFQSVGLYAIAKRRGINNPWLAWIPVGRDWMLGCVADQYQYVARGQVKNKRKILLGLAIASMILSFVESRTSGQMLSELIAGNQPSAQAGVSALLGLAGTAVSITALVFHHMALYDLYGSCCPDNKVLFLVLGIIFGFTQPFFIFFNRKKDDGMPPRIQPQYSAPNIYNEPPVQP